MAFLKLTQKGPFPRIASHGSIPARAPMGPGVCLLRLPADSPLASDSPAVTRFTSESSPVSFSSFAAEAKPGPALFPLCFMGEGHLDQNGPWAGPSTFPRKVARVDVRTVGKGGPGIPLGPDGRVPDVQDEACWEVSSTLVGHVGLWA